MVDTPIVIVVVMGIMFVVGIYMAVIEMKKMGIKEIIKRHPVIAAREILKPISKIQDIIPIIENHHENWDGNGYPGHKSGMEIPISSQIVLLVDAFYAMSQDRPYRQAYTIDEIIQIIRKESGKQWNEQLVEDFIRLIKEK